ncbi:MAG: hypothetical protein M1825_001108 [Sarcosagium campestre]|nr:MAG: hypothetical protein M1825_001108 [Sarcosagium campestre]
MSRRSLRSSGQNLMESTSPTMSAASSRPRRTASSQKSSVTVARPPAIDPEDPKKSIHLTVKIPSSKLREATSGASRLSREGLELGEIVSGPRGTRAKRAIVEDSESDAQDDEDVNLDNGEEDEIEHDEELDDEEPEDDEVSPDSDDADGDLEMEDAPPPPIMKSTAAQPGSKPSVKVTPAGKPPSQSVEAKEMGLGGDEDDDEELSELESEEEGLQEDVAIEEGDVEDEEGEDLDEGDEGEEEEEEEEEEEGEDVDDATPASGSRASTPDLAKLTKRQRSRLDEVMGGDLLEIPNETKAKKILSAEEHAMRRAEMARRRKNLSEKRNEEEKMDTINKLLKKQAPKQRKARGAEGGDASPSTDDAGVARAKSTMKLGDEGNAFNIGTSIQISFLELSLSNASGKPTSCALIAVAFGFENQLSRIAFSDRDDPVNSADATRKDDERDAVHTSRSEPETTQEAAPTSLSAQSAKDRNANYGSAARRSARNRKPKDVPRILFPDWFLKKNIRLDHLTRSAPQALDIYTDTTSVPATTTQRDTNSSASNPPPSSDEEEQSREGPAADAQEDQGNTRPLPPSPARYHLHSSIWDEVLAAARAGLALPLPSYADSFPAFKTQLLLHCPKDGGTFFLSSLVERIRHNLGADLITVDAQDIAEIGGEYLGEGPYPSLTSIRSLGYNSREAIAKRDSREIEDEAEEDEEFVDDEDEEHPAPSQRNALHFPTLSISALPIGKLQGRLEEMRKSSPGLFSFISPPVGRDVRSDRLSAASEGASPDSWEEIKLTSLVASIVDSRSLADTSRSNLQESSEGDETHPALDASARAPSPVTSHSEKPLILVVQDYKEIQTTAVGSRFLDKLHHRVRALRKGGQRVLLIGTVASADLTPSLSRSGFRNLQSEHEDGPGRTIIVTPRRGIDADRTFAEDESRRIRQINLRHLQDILRRRAGDQLTVASILQDADPRLDSSVEFASGLEESVWSFDRVHRLAHTAIGLLSQGEELTTATIELALKLLNASDEVKFSWASEERLEQRSLEEASEEKIKTASVPIIESEGDVKMKRIRKSCNSYEKKLLGGVVNPENIRTAFSDVHAPAETVEALKTLTSLSLIRPEAFSYGVLATDKIPGLLLYGPPGTGKTLLAKAVAKESGATVLEVSGSDVYDMYVGEGEKNVKAIFTLAKKLSPCVVFIDEADAIFGSRGSHGNRTSHRELINQFLREWDGMNDLSAFIMVATNRPFDLDDAVLRRLPRRLLVDLPVEADREAILRIHLVGEQLEPSVSLAHLAAKTPFYSGSDLKNLCVAAALACVREENATAVAHSNNATRPTPSPSPSPSSPTPPPSATAEPARTPSPEEAYKYPEKRTLAARHFDRAIEEISASISEDMSSLSAIKKFDEKYGDRKGRKKKRGWGFGSAEESGSRVETERVRG